MYNKAVKIVRLTDIPCLRADRKKGGKLSMKKKLLAVLLTGIMVMSLAACGNSSSGDAPSDGGRLRLRQKKGQRQKTVIH